MPIFTGMTNWSADAPSDAREGIYARFAVVRRARQILCWR
jgi:hypothetical protein